MSQATDGPPNGAASAGWMISWVVTSAGITGLFYTIGYVAESSYQNFLGVVTSPSGPTDYLLAAGEFFVTVWRESARFLYLLVAQPGWGPSATVLAVGTIAVLLILVALGFAYVRQRPRGPARQRKTFVLATKRAWLIASALLIAVTMIEMFYLDWPLIAIEHVLVNRTTLDRYFVSQDPQLASRFRTQTGEIWKEIVCSRVSSHVEKRCEGTMADHATKLQRYFLLDVYITVALTVFGLLLLQSLRMEGSFVPGPAMTVVAACVAGVVIANLLTVPYVYAKIARDTTTKEIIIHRQAGGLVRGDLEPGTSQTVIVKDASGWRWQIPRSSIRALRVLTLGGTQQAVVDYEAGSTYDEIQGYVLADSDKRIVVYEKEERRIWEMPRDRIRVIKAFGVVDVIGVHIQYSYGPSR